MWGLLRRLPPAFLLTACVLAHGNAAATADDYEARFAAYKTAARSNSLAVRTLGQERLAESKDRRAIDVLGRLYKAPRSPKTRSRHLIAGVLARHFDGAGFVDDLAALRRKYAKPRDAWLWFRTLVIQGRHRGTSTLWDIARDVELPAALRAAAIEAGVALADPGVAALVPELLADMPREEADRALLVASLATGLLGVRNDLDEDVLARAADALIEHVASDLASESTRVVVGRVLQQLLDARFAYLDGATWRLHRERPGKARKSDGRRLQVVRCAGVKALGRRIAYVIDASEGALQPVSEEERERLLGPREDVSNRLTLMRRAVRESIRDLKPEQSFVVLYQAHRHWGTPGGLDGLRPATEENKAQAISALQETFVGGAADLHAGLTHALQAHPEGFALHDEAYVAPETILGGCDTLFLFAHSPSRLDAWIAKDPTAREEPFRTLASGGAVQGLYADPIWLAEDLLRQRLFHKVKPYCLGFGEAYGDILALVARAADGYWPLTAAQQRPRRAATRKKPDEKYEKVKAGYEADLKRPSLRKRTRGRVQLATTGSPLALDVLARSYPQAEEPVPLVQQLIVDICYQWFRRKQTLAAFDRWRGRHAERNDAWLWHRALMMAIEHDQLSAALRAGRCAHDPFLRAAATRAATKQRVTELLELIPDWVRDVRASQTPDLHRGLEIEALATALSELRKAKDEDVYKTAALALLDVFDDRTTSHRTKLTIVRNLAAGLEVPPEGLSKQPWVREVRAGGSGVGMDDHRYGAPTFGGLRASGKRICYVIDMSDSMLAPLEPNERMDPKVVTGDREGSRRRPEDAINWARVNNRFDLARALLIMSLQTLPQGTKFCVIWFGNEAGTLDSTKGLVPATPEHVARTVKELKAIRPGPVGEAGTAVEWGSLKGETNLHGGLLRAFTRTSGKPLEGFTYVSEEALTEGCDTIFVLSDGAPTTDDFVQEDKRDPKDRAVADRETGKRVNETPTLRYPGPYGAMRERHQIFNDIERRNLFRQVEIHCLGIGGADMSVLRRLARIGLGQSRKIGDDARDD